jgi:hypothetical protein
MERKNGLNNVKVKKTKDDDIELSSNENYQIILFYIFFTLIL